jgi:hypothetical protein
MYRSELKLDHAALLVRRLDRAAIAFERMGFRLTPRSVHEGPLEPGGRTMVWGTSSHCAMFADSYLELIGAASDTEYGRGVNRRAEQREGIHLVALGASDLAETHATLTGRVPGLEAPVTVIREWPLGNDSRPAMFRMAQLNARDWPEGEFALVEHRTPELLWQEEHLDHPNGALELSFIVIASKDPLRSRQRFGQLTGTSAGPVCKLQHGRITITDPVGIARRYPGVTASNAPFPVALGIRVRDLSATERMLRSKQVPFLTTPNGSIWVDPAHAGGAVVELVEEAEVKLDTPATDDRRRRAG